MKNRKTIKQLTVALGIFMLLAVTIQLFHVGSVYSENPGTCYDCYEIDGIEICGLDTHGTTGCKNDASTGKCKLTGIACNIEHE